MYYWEEESFIVTFVKRVIIQYQVVLAYLPKERREYEDGSDTLYPEGIETVHPKFAITWRNRYMIDSADI